MESVVWSTFELPKKKLATKSKKAIVSVNSNVVFLNDIACGLIDGIYEYQFAEIMEGSDSKGNIKCLAVKFTKEQNENSLAVKIRERKGVRIGVSIGKRVIMNQLCAKGVEKRRYVADKLDETTVAFQLASK